VGRVGLVLKALAASPYRLASTQTRSVLVAIPARTAGVVRAFLCSLMLMPACFWMR